MCGGRGAGVYGEGPTRCSDAATSGPLAMKSIEPAAFIVTIAPIAGLPAALDELRVALHQRQRRSDLLGSLFC
jgi:hypothetical protein